MTSSRRPGIARYGLTVAWLLVACEAPQEKESITSAKFGVFFGGQIEERRDVPFELDSSKQTQGFRIEFGAPLMTDAQVSWTIGMPAGSAPKPRRPKSGEREPEAHRKAISGQATIHAGLSRFEQVTPFEPGDPLGLWNARVVVRGKVVIDRAFEVYDKGERSRATVVDGGGR